MGQEKKNIINGAFDRHREVLAKALEPSFLTEAQAGADLFCGVVLKGGCVFACGNGGSAADAQHLVAELLCRYKDDRRPLPAVTLTVDASTVTAIGNDYDFKEVFARQLQALGKSGDLLVAFTTSGSSPNVLRAIAIAKEKQMKVIVFTGAKGEGLRNGAAASAIDALVVVPTEETARVQEIHELTYHAWCELLDARLLNP